MPIGEGISGLGIDWIPLTYWFKDVRFRIIGPCTWLVGQVILPNSLLHILGIKNGRTGIGISQRWATGTIAAAIRSSQDCQRTVIG